ncbi:MAG: hypothetical protein ABIN91_18935 [Mucilaginibacter sp.]|uniref:hypothetical protein n=1 Tax=Mucilaginibacter sp. TaxID=1882438 RepID=UPI0032660DFC
MKNSIKLSALALVVAVAFASCGGPKKTSAADSAAKADSAKMAADTTAKKDTSISKADTVVKKDSVAKKM